MKARSTKRRRNAAELMLMGANPSRRNQAGMAMLGGAVGGATAAMIGHQLRKRLRNPLARPNPRTLGGAIKSLRARGASRKAIGRMLSVATNPKLEKRKAKRGNPAWVRTPHGTVGRVLEVSGGPGRGPRRHLLYIPGMGPRWVSGRVYPVDPRATGISEADIARIEAHRNPNAEEMYETFQGKPATGATEVKEPAEPDAELAQLGELRGLTTHLRGHGDLELKFSHADAVKLAANAEGTQLYFIGGEQSIDLHGLPVDAAKRYVDLGEAKEVIYRAAKVHTDFQASDWVHEFGEEGGARPRLTYDRERKRLELAGGSYHVDAPGIIN